MTPTSRPRRSTPKAAARKSAPRKKRAPGAAATAPAAAAAPTAPEPPQAQILRVVRGALEDMKALDVREFDVRGLSDVTDFMVIASGTSDRHVKSVADRIVRDAKQAGVRPFGVEGQREGEWVLVDLPDVLVHVMLPRVRELYALEQLWSPPRRR